MPKGTNQKLKLYRLAQIMLENTDDEHYITMPEIMEELGKYEVTADRKTIYADLRDLSVLGIEVEGEPIGNRYHYRVVNRPFELPELKLLVDSIQSSKFITEKKTNTLIKKLEKLVSKYDAQRLQRQVYVSGRIKTMNESIYYTVDAIHNAISENKKIKFQYFQWNVKKEMELRHGGAWYHISPWGLSWDDENYYMIGYDAETQLIKHYRVDKMLHIRMSDESREGKEHFKNISDIQCDGEACNGLKFSGCYIYYKPVMAMAKMVLDDISIESNGDVSTTGYILPYAISMEKLFEVYVRAYFKKNGIASYRSKSNTGIRLEKYDNKTDVFLEEEGLENPGKYISGSIKPDLILTDQESGETMVLDVKYKDYRNGDSRDDRLQLLAYSMMMNANNIGIILPAQDEVEIFDARRINSMENRVVKYHQMLLGIMKDNPVIANYIKTNAFKKKE